MHWTTLLLTGCVVGGPSDGAPPSTPSDTGSMSSLGPEAGAGGCGRVADPDVLSRCLGNAAVGGTSPYATVDGAVAAAEDGDTVWVCPGTHAVSLDEVPGDLQLRAVDPTPGLTVLDGGSDRVLDVRSAGALLLDALELRGDGHLIEVSHTDLELSCVDVVGQSGSITGWVEVYEGSLTVEGGLWRDVQDTQGIGSLIVVRSAPVSLSGTRFLDNRIGEILQTDEAPEVLLHAVEARNNEGSEILSLTGDAEANAKAPPSLVILDSVVSGNRSNPLSAWGYDFSVPLTVEVIGSDLSDNIGRVAIDVSEVTLSDVSIEANAPIFNHWPQGHGAWSQAGGALSCTDCDFGTGARDNEPGDVTLAEAHHTFGDDVDFDL